VQALGEPVFGGPPDGVVRLGPDACFDVAVEGFEPVLDDGLGLDGDFAPDPPAVCVVSEADHSPPAAVAVPVPRGRQEYSESESNASRKWWFPSLLWVLQASRS